MDKKTAHLIMSIVLGIAAFVIVATVISLLFGAIITEDPMEIAETSKSVDKVLMYIKNSSIAVVCIAIPTIVCYFFTYFSKSKKVFGLISALLSLMLIAMCIGFIFDLRAIVFKLTDNVSTCYTLATAYFTDMIKLLVPSAFACAYFTGIAVCALRADTPAATAQPEQTDVAAPEQGE